MNNAARLSDLEGVFGNFIGIILSIVGVAVLVMFVIAGYKYLSAGGDKEAASSARNTLTFAIIGLVLAISAWMIINILGNFLGITDIGNFTICLPGQTC